MFAIIVCTMSMLECFVLPFAFVDNSECMRAAEDYQLMHPEYPHVGCTDVSLRPLDGDNTWME